MAKPNHKNSLWKRFSTWFSNLDRSDKIGVVLIALTGVGLLAMLFSGGLKNFLTLPGADAGKVPSKTAAPKGLKECEGFVGKIPGPTERLDLVLFGELHDRHDEVVGCLNAIVKSRGNPAHVIRAESVQSGRAVNCTDPGLRYGNEQNRTCLGWNDSRVPALMMGMRFCNGASEVLDSLPFVLDKKPKAVTLQDMQNLMTNLKSMYGVSAAICNSSDGGARPEIKYECFLARTLQSIIESMKKGVGFPAARDHKLAALSRAWEESMSQLTTPELVRARNVALATAAGSFAERLTFFIAGACHLSECLWSPGGAATRRAIEDSARKTGQTAVVLISKKALSDTKKANQQMQIRDQGL